VGLAKEIARLLKERLALRFRGGTAGGADRGDSAARPALL